ncbi:probable receptor-like protein kinase at5g39020 [Phtheirospermum japonicum]|uniref:Probable receptor-like protein kinase at5g39020 n=1 Tax=Phtheirospermum japonicum TaxID=374723 RepID=A0A830C4U9_9LAMI|nr:probable receptor-like protein kinase at5g39020 [Phtheirospermum japonicum]
MLLLEMAGRRKNMNPFTDDVGQIYFPSWAYDRIHAGKDIEIKDADDEERRMVRKIIVVALWCIHMKLSDRPSMSKVVEMLEGDCELQMPAKPFVAPREITEDQ